MRKPGKVLVEKIWAQLTKTRDQPPCRPPCRPPCQPPWATTCQPFVFSLFLSVNLSTSIWATMCTFMSAAMSANMAAIAMSTMLLLHVFRWNYTSHWYSRNFELKTDINYRDNLVGRPTNTNDTPLFRFSVVPALVSRQSLRIITTVSMQPRPIKNHMHALSCNTTLL